MANHYVRGDDGSNANTGHTDSPSGAWKTVDWAVDHVTTGDTIYVHEAVNGYPEFVTINITGITVQAYPGEHVMIWGTVSMDNKVGGLILIDQCSNVILDGFEIQAEASYLSDTTYILQGVRIRNASGSVKSNITVKNCYIHSFAGSGINVSWSLYVLTNVYIDNCELYHTNRKGDQESISLLAIDTFEVKNCYVHNVLGLTGSIGNYHQKEGICPKVQCKNGTVHNNIIDDAVVGIYVGGDGGGSGANTSVYNNVVFNCTNGIVESSESTNPCNGFVIYNNLAYNCYACIYIKFISWSFTVSNTNVVNNTVYGAFSYGIRFGGSDTFTTTCYARNNLIHGLTAGSYGIEYVGTHVAIDHNLFYNPSGWNAANNYGLDAKSGNPYLVLTSINRSAGGKSISTISLMLTSSSALAINQGTNSFSPGVDFNGVVRPVGTYTDIGAFEYQPVGGVTCTPTKKSLVTSLKLAIVALSDNKRVVPTKLSLVSSLKIPIAYLDKIATPSTLAMAVAASIPLIVIPTVPVAETLPATNITDETATLWGRVVSDGGAVNQVRFRYRRVV